MGFKQIEQTVLVAEEDAGIAALIHSNLVNTGFRVEHATDADEVLKKARDLRPALVVLNMTMCGIAGKDLLRAMKSNPGTSSIPVVALSGHTEEIDRIIALELGADDYLSKPFSPRELALRVRAILARRGLRQERIAKPSIGILRMDLDGRTVTVNGKTVNLSALDFRLLTVLMSARGGVVSREKLVEMAWGQDSNVSPRTVDTQLRRLRGKLGAAAHQVQTVRGFGYRIGE